MSFAKQLKDFNNMYGLPVNSHPSYLGEQRLKDLKDILLKEVAEIDEIIGKSSLISATEKLVRQHETDGETIKHNLYEMQLEVLTDVADLMGDLQVYCGSEMAKWGLPMNAVLYIIMASNMSKLGADGKPIVDERGKVVKGPHYWKPEPLLCKLLADIAGAQPQQNEDFPMYIAHLLVAAKQAELALVP